MVECVMSKIKMRDQRTGRILPSGGETIDRRGYIYICINIIKNPTIREMCKQSVLNRAYGKERSGRIYKHHLVMIEHLNRPLIKGEMVHHKDGNPQNNDFSNLILLSQKEHIWDYRNLMFENRRLKDIIEKHHISY